MPQLRAQSRRQADGGFTLLEMLVVVLIMGLLIGLVRVVVQPDARGQLRVEAERLAQLLDLAAAEARLSGQTLGWTASGPAYQFWRFREETGWLEIIDNDLLRARVLPPGMTIAALRVENMQRRGGMRLEFTPDAPPTLFVIELALGAEQYVVAAAPGGTVRAEAGGGSANAAPAL
jgi:general secretion pathway protein H